ncbi:NUDIX hydrolase [Yoonia sp. BS5-3]|uniref:NUDIX hydrolase n=1 Tax=Yoonia phaeophyticola TaxID=3137369 RepID=A0ABZ2VBC9_9RHOB
MISVSQKQPALGDTPCADTAAPLTQVAALCTREGKKGTKILLVKSSRGRWILPKGWPMDDRTDAQAAKCEAWEEAGVAKGRIGKTPIGTYLAKKRFDDGRVVPCLVAVYPLAVKSTVDHYPESETRERKWFPVKKAIKRVDETGLKDILRALLS